MRELGKICVDRRWLVPAALAFGLMPAAAQKASAPAASLEGPYRVAGTVVNAITGEPIRRASVAVLAEVDSHAVESTLTNNEGRFVLSGLAAAKYQLTAAKRGFRTAFYDEHDEYSTAIVTGADQDTGNLTFRLMPGAVLRGVVTGDGGDPVEGARVMLFLKPREHDPEDRIFQADATTTDDTGAYEFSNLSAGEYSLAVTAEPWYSLHRTAGAGDAKPASDPALALDVAYPITYFDSTIEEASATPITLTAGSMEEANVSLHAVPALHLTVQVPRRQDGSIARPELRQSIFGVQVSAESMGLFDAMRTGTVEFSGVAPGRYELAQGDPPRIVDLDATASQQIDPATGTPTVDVSGMLKTASGAGLPGEVTVAMESQDTDRRHDPMQTNAPRGAFRFTGVSPGRWVISAQTGGRRLPVISIGTGGRTRAGNAITVADRPLQLTLMVSSAEQRVEGFARKDGKGFAGAMVLLVPKDLASIRELARRDQSDSDGSFSLRDVAPGPYTIVAIQEGWNLNWAEPAVIRRFLPHGTAVTVSEAAGKLITVPGPVEVQSP